MDIIQLCDRIEAAADYARETLNDETTNRQHALEQLLDALAAATVAARHSPHRPHSMVSAVGDGGTSIQVGGHYYGR